MSRYPSQEWDPIVSEILQKCACRNLECACHQHAARVSGTTHCPICGELTLYVESRGHRVTVALSCSCTRNDVLDALRCKGIELDRLQP